MGYEEMMLGLEEVSKELEIRRHTAYLESARKRYGGMRDAVDAAIEMLKQPVMEISGIDLGRVMEEVG